MIRWTAIRAEGGGVAVARRARALRTALVAPAALAATLATASAQQPSGGADSLLERLNLKAKVPPASDFVEQSRPKAPSGFIPVGTRHPARATKVMTPAEVAATEADLDNLRERQQRRAGLTPALVPLKPATGAGKTTNR